MSIKIRLLQHRLTQTWLIYQLERLGVSVDKFTLCTILSGTRKGPFANHVLDLSDLALKKYEESYERQFNS